VLFPTIIFIFEFFVKDPKIITNLMQQENVFLVSVIASTLFSAFGLGLVLRVDASTGGMDIIQMLCHKYLKVQFSHVMIVTDGIVVLCGFVYYLLNSKLDLMFYSLIIVVCCAVIVDHFTTHGQNGYTFFIISEKYEEIQNEILEKINHGVTKIDCVGSYTNEPKKMLICTIYRIRLLTVKELIMRIDKDSFFFVLSSREVWGEGFKWK
jgi:uncharacterized membrane-anchored protein YitT (DUF2179 family)